MSERSGDIVQSLKTTLPSYVSESRDAASTIHAFVTASGAQQLGSVLVTSAGAVEEGVVELSQNTQQVVRVLNEENRLLRAELLKTWQTASSVAVEKAADVSQQGETNSYDVSDVVKRSLEQVRDYLQSLHENSTTATTDQLSQVVEQLMESNAKLEAEKRVMGLEYVPRSAYDATELRCQRLTAELNAATASRQLAAAQLEEARALANVQSMRLAAPSQEQSSEDNRRSSPGAASSELLSGAAHASVSLLGSANGVWRVAIRQLEEHGAVAVSHKIQSMEVDALRAEISQLHQRNETLVVELKTARQMMQALERDLEVQRSLRQKMQEKLTEALSTQPFADVPVGPLRSQAIGSSIPLEPSRLPSLQPAQRGQPLGRIAAHDPSSVRGAEEDETLLNISAMSPAPRAVPNAVPAAAGARHCSVEQLIDENQSLYKQVLELQRSDRQLFADSSAGDRKRARSERAPSAEPVTTSDVGTSTDAVIELTSRLPGQITLAQSLPLFHASASRCIDVASGSAAERLSNTMLGVTSRVHADQIQNARQIEAAHAEAMQSFLKQAVSVSVANAVKASQLEQDVALLREQRDHLIDDLLARDSLPVLGTLASSLQRAARSVESKDVPSTAQPAASDTPQTPLLNASSIVPLMESLTSREEALGELVRNAPKVASLWTAVTRTPTLVEVERLEQALTISQEELQLERARVKKLISQAHDEKTKHVAQLDRLWQAEETAKECAEEAASLRQQIGRMLTEDQFHELSNRCQLAESQVEQRQQQVDSLLAENNRVVEEYRRCEGRLSEAQWQHQQTVESLRAEVTSLSVVVQSGAQMLQAERRERESAALSASRFQTERDSIRSKLHFTESQLEQARVALLSQLPTIELLKSLFPGGSMEDAMSDRLNRFAAEIQRLQSALTNTEAKLVEERRALMDALAEKQQADVERQRLNALWRSSMLHDVVDENSARHQLSELCTQVQSLQHEVHILRQERDLLKTREAVYEERIATLAADPVSYNARKYGLAKTKTIQEQLELVDLRCKELTVACDKLSSEKQQAETACEETRKHLETVQQAKTATEAELVRLQSSAQALQTEMQQQKASNVGLQEQLQRLQSDIETKSALLQSQTAHISAAESALKTMQAAQSVGEKQRDGLVADNLALTEEIRKLKQLVVSFEAERKEHAIALRNLALRQHVQQQQQGASSRGGGGGGGGTAMHGNSSVGASSSFQEALLKKSAVLKQR